MPRPRDITVDLALNIRLVHRGVLVKVLDHLVARPMIRVNAGVDDQANVAPHFVFEAAIFAIGILISIHLIRESLGVQRPPFDKGCVPAISAEFRKTGQFLRQRNLQMMPRNALMIGDCLDVQQQAMLGIVFIDIDVPWT